MRLGGVRECGTTADRDVGIVVPRLSRLKIEAGDRWEVCAASLYYKLRVASHRDLSLFPHFKLIIRIQ